MGDIGDYWNEHRKYKQKRKYGSVEGVECPIWDKIQKDAEEARKPKRTVQCECGKQFVDVPAHNCHKSRFGKQGHKGSPITSSEGE